MTFILVIAVVGCSRVLAVVGFLGPAHKLNQSDAGMDTARGWVPQSILYRAKSNSHRNAARSGRPWLRGAGRILGPGQRDLYPGPLAMRVVRFSRRLPPYHGLTSFGPGRNVH